MVLESKEALSHTTVKELENIKKSVKAGSEIQSSLEDEHIRNHQLDRALKQKHARCFMVILIGQLFVMNLVFICVGLDYLHYHYWTIELYMVGTLAQVFGVVLVMTKNLFPSKIREDAI